MKYVVITGVSTGIGRAAAGDLAANGYHVFGSVRKQADADTLKTQIGENFTPLLFDVTDHDAVKAAAEQVSDTVKGQGLAGLVNNAGIGIGGPLQHIPLDQLRLQFEVNVFGLIAVTQAFLPLLGAKLPQTHPPGRIINVSSVGGKLSFPFLGAYNGSKFAVESMSDVLRRELMLYGIDVIVIEPGSVQTAIWDKAEEADVSPYLNTDYAPILERFSKYFISTGRAGKSPEALARIIREALENPRPKTRYATPDNYLMGWLLPRLLPDRWLDRLIASQLGLKRRAI